MDHVNLDHVKDFVTKMDILDLKRNTKWKEVLPDVFELLNKHCLGIFEKG
jgi:hypothetical protein